MVRERQRLCSICVVSHLHFITAVFLTLPGTLYLKTCQPQLRRCGGLLLAVPAITRLQLHGKSKSQNSGQRLFFICSKNHAPIMCRCRHLGERRQIVEYVSEG